MRAQQPVCLLVAENLDEAVCFVVGFGPAVGSERELAHSILDACQKTPSVNIKCKIQLHAQNYLRT